MVIFTKNVSIKNTETLLLVSVLVKLVLVNLNENNKIICSDYNKTSMMHNFCELLQSSSCMILIIMYDSNHSLLFAPFPFPPSF